MTKKKDKKKFKRKKIRLKNINAAEIEEFENEEFLENKQADKRKIEKMKHTPKSDVELIKGRILEIRTNYKCLVDLDGQKKMCFLSGRLKQLKLETKNIVSVGDYVNVDVAGKPRIEEILSRKNALVRFDEKGYQTEIVIAANIDQVIITASCKNPELKLGLVDRYICSARISEINPVICINKIDLVDDLDIIKEKLEFYEKSRLEVIYTSAKENIGIDRLKALLKNKVSVFSGSSGTGKSTIINRLQPGLNLRVSKVSDYSNKGVHTTSESKLVECCSFKGYLIDTPGIRTFGLSNEDKAKIKRVFPGFDKLYGKCKFSDCTHIHEKVCAVKEAVKKNNLPENRYNSYLRIYDSLDDKY